MVNMEKFFLEQGYAPAVCKACGERLGWVAVSPNLKDYVFELVGHHPECPTELRKEG